MFVALGMSNFGARKKHRKYQEYLYYFFPKNLENSMRNANKCKRIEQKQVPLSLVYKHPKVRCPPPKKYIPSTLNIDLILWHTQLIVCAVKC